MSPGDSPRVRGNDWGSLQAPEPDAHTPSLTVSIVVPAYRAGATLPYTLAALQAQSYPSHLLEVVVVDDDDGPPLDLPEIRPDNTRCVTSGESWGRAQACRTGAAVAEGSVLHWLDADMVPRRDQVAQQMRWHHASDHAVVLGHKLFLDDTDLPPVEAVHEAVVQDRLEQLFDGRPAEEHHWVEDIWRRTDELRTAGFRAFHVHVGATASVGRGLYEEAGGMDVALKLGEDVEFGYRLAARGAVFVAERSATSWHLGRSHLMRHGEEVQRFNAPYVAQRIPDLRKFRQERGRSYRVPFVEAVVETAGHRFEETQFSVDGLLGAVPSDLQVRVVGPWSQLTDERRELLRDPLLEQRLVREEYAGDPRVVLVEEVGESAFPAQFRLRLPAGWRPGPTSLDDLTRRMQKRSQGLVSILLGDGQVARLERTAALERARRVIREGEDLDDVVDLVSETRWIAGEEVGFEHHAATVPGAAPPARRAQPALDSPGRDASRAAPAVVGRRRLLDLFRPRRPR